MNESAITVDGVWKRYERRGSHVPTLKETALRLGRAPTREWFWALQDIDLEVARGETVGVIGANGSGKSTLLRLLAGIGRPTRGRIIRHRSVAAMLSLGESFEPLLTGRENAVTAAILAGDTMRQARAKLDGIVAFAELEEAFEQPLRTYSDGMRLRLAFSVAVSSEPEVLLIDEVLSVGDLRFQDKCFSRLAELQALGTTIVLASHDEHHVRRLCSRVAWMAAGHIQVMGSPDIVYGAYHESVRAETDRRAADAGHRPRYDAPNTTPDERVGTLEVEIARVAIEPSTIREPVTPVRPLTLTIDLDPRRTIRDPIVTVTLLRVSDGTAMLSVNTEGDGVSIGAIEHPIRVQLVLDRLDLAPGSYCFDVGVYEASWSYIYDYHWQSYPLELVTPITDAFGPPRQWRMPADE